MNSLSLTPMRRKVSRMVGHVPSPTPIAGTSGDSSSVTVSPAPCRALWSAAMMPAVSQPAEPPPTITNRFTGSIARHEKGKAAGRPAAFRQRRIDSELLTRSEHVSRTGLGHEQRLVLVATVDPLGLVRQVDDLGRYREVVGEVVAGVR